MITNYKQAREINETVRQFGLINATPGELAAALASRLDRNTEMKIPPPFSGGIFAVEKLCFSTG